MCSDRLLVVGVWSRHQLQVFNTKDLTDRNPHCPHPCSLPKEVKDQKVWIFLEFKSELLPNYLILWCVVSSRLWSYLINFTLSDIWFFDTSWCMSPSPPKTTSEMFDQLFGSYNGPKQKLSKLNVLFPTGIRNTFLLSGRTKTYFYPFFLSHVRNNITHYP